MIALRAFLVVVLLARCAIAADAPFTVIERAYAPYMAADDPLAFPMKVRSLAADPYKFWRGSKDLFFVWCKTNSADWLSDGKSFLPNHGDLHLGNIGAYARTGEWGKLAFGMVDFDDCATLPFQIELLQGLITLKLTAKQNNIAFDDEQLAKTLLDSYRIAVNSRRNATALLVDEQDKTVTKMLARQSTAYAEELAECTLDGRFRRVIVSDKGKLKDILRSAMARADDLAGGIAKAIENEPDLKQVLRFTSTAEVRAAVIDIVQRTRLDSSGSQGLKKYLVLLRKPFRGRTEDVILYLKQEIPSAAERSGAVERSRWTSGQRVKQDMDRLTDPLPFINSWCEITGESYWVSFKEPWSSEMDPGDIKTAADLPHAARIWAFVVGATHREEGRFETILPRLTPELLTLVRQRANAFVARIESDFEAFRSDPRVADLISRANAAIAEFHK